MDLYQRFCDGTTGVKMQTKILLGLFFGTLCACDYDDWPKIEAIVSDAEATLTSAADDELFTLYISHAETTYTSRELVPWVRGIKVNFCGTEYEVVREVQLQLLFDRDGDDRIGQGDTLLATEFGENNFDTELIGRTLGLSLGIYSKESVVQNLWNGEWTVD